MTGARASRDRVPDTRLHAIAGRWHTSGHVIGEPPLPIVGTDDYEVVAGGYFLLHRVDVTVGAQAVSAVEVIGEPAPGGTGYIARSFDGEGNCELMHLAVLEERVLRFTGGSDIAPAARPTGTQEGYVRATLRVAADGRSMAALWERSDNGKEWRPWMDVSFSRRHETPSPAADR